ncbi:thioredoxin [Paenibacillus macerans]|uniref:thioredoxin n=1 Tax=Paenibacillus macerans TaxID=44252 RepID=UPI003D312608
MTMKRINSETDFSEAVHAPGMTLVDFDAPWCPPCKVLAPILEELHGDFGGKVNVLKVNCDELPGLASQYGVMSMPTVIFFHHGEPVEKLVGLRPKEAYARLIAKYPAPSQPA